MRSEFAPFSRDPIAVIIGGRPFWIPYRPAAVWVQYSDRVTVLAARLADESDREAMADLVMSRPGAREDLAQESRRILTGASGRKWWEAASLLATSTGTEVQGRLVLAGVDPWARSLGEWCAATYALCVKGLDEKKRLQLDFRLAVPPPGFEDEWDDDGGDDPEAVQAAVAKMMG